MIYVNGTDGHCLQIYSYEQEIYLAYAKVSNIAVTQRHDNYNRITVDLNLTFIIHSGKHLVLYTDC